jgi:hypothetical protein
MVKAYLPSLVVVIFGLLTVARALDVTGYSYYPKNATALREQFVNRLMFHRTDGVSKTQT